jgi:peptide chain release factor 1
MLDKLAQIERRYEELDRLLSDPATMNDYEKLAEYSKERSGLTEIIETYRDYKRQLEQLDDARALANEETDPDLLQMAQEEIASLETSTEDLAAKLKVLLLPKDPRDEKNVIMEIRAGTGGDEAGLFAADLYRMYSYYAQQRGWKIDIFDQSETGVGGFKGRARSAASSMRAASIGCSAYRRRKVRGACIPVPSPSRCWRRWTTWTCS